MAGEEVRKRSQNQQAKNNSNKQENDRKTGKPTQPKQSKESGKKPKPDKPTEQNPVAPTVQEKKSNQYWLDVVIILFCVAIAAAKLLYRIDKPKTIVWDETHFTKFSTWYYSGHYFVDIHPPIAKLIMAIFIWLSGYEKLEEENVAWWTAKGFVGTMDFEHIYHSDTFIYVRIASVMMGILLVIFTYLALRALGCRRISCLFATWMVLTDGLITVDSRLILTDIYLWCFHVMTIFATFASTVPRSTSLQFLWCAITGALLGCTVSVKYTAFGTVGFVGVHQGVYLLYSHFRIAQNPKIPFFTLVKSFFLNGIGKAIIILGIAIFVFFSIWTIHWYILPYRGQGDGFMEEDFQETLIPYQTPREKEQALLGGCPNHANAWYDCGHPTITPDECTERGCCWDPTSPQKWCYYTSPPEFTPAKLPWVDTMKAMLYATWKNNQGATLNFHPQMSRWWQWPLQTCKLVDFGHGIYSIGNPITWWLVAFVELLSFSFVTLYSLSIILAITPFDFFQRLPRKMPPVLVIFVLVASYIGNWFPFYFITRSTWNYHYMLALLLGIVLVAYVFDCILSFVSRSRSFELVILVIFLLMLAMGIAFWYWSPWVYGFNLTAKQHLARRWWHQWGV